MSDFNFISTYPKCDLCFSDIAKSPLECNRCSNCLTWYHLQCEKKFYGNNFSNNECYKCTINPSQSSCFVCGIKTGLMIRCNGDKWIHVLCLKSLKDFFYLKTPNNYMLKIKAMLKKRKRCNICSKKNHFILTCKQCKINFHPYCAFRSNFKVVANENENCVKFPCDNIHQRYKVTPDETDSSDETETNDDTDLETKSFEEEQINEILQDPQKTYHKESSTVNRLKIDLTKEKEKNRIGSIDLSFLKKNLISSGIYNEFNFTNCVANYHNYKEGNKGNNNYDWKNTDKYFYYFEKNDLTKIFPRELQEEQNSNFPLNVKEYKICTIYKKGNSYFIVYDTTNVKKEDFSLQKATFNNTSSEKTEYDFINKKRYLNRKFGGKVEKDQKDDWNLTFNDSNIQLVRAFKLNNISNKILTLEKYAIYSSENLCNDNRDVSPDYSSFIDTEIRIKEKMLEKISKMNSKFITKIENSILTKLNYPKYSNYKNNESLTPLHKLNSDYIYTTIMKRLGGGILPKPKDIVYEDNYCECCICFDYNPETLTPIIYCDKCNVGIHQACYGIKHIPEDQYICDLCLSKHKKFKCILCKRGKGAMKKVDKGTFAHVTCILLSNYYMFTDYALMNNIMILNKDIPTNELCGSCNKSGEMIHCRSCSKKYHFFCAYFEGFYLIMRYGDDGRYPRAKKAFVEIICCFCGDISGQWTFEDRKEQQNVRIGLYQSDKKINNKKGCNL